MESDGEGSGKMGDFDDVHSALVKRRTLEMDASGKPWNIGEFKMVISRPKVMIWNNNN